MHFSRSQRILSHFWSTADNEIACCYSPAGVSNLEGFENFAEIKKKKKEIALHKKMPT